MKTMDFIKIAHEESEAAFVSDCLLNVSSFVNGIHIVDKEGLETIAPDILQLLKGDWSDGITKKDRLHDAEVAVVRSKFISQHQIYALEFSNNIERGIMLARYAGAKFLFVNER